MKNNFNKILVLLCFCISLASITKVSAQTLWYYKGTGALNSTSSWTLNSNGTDNGTLSDFTSGGRYFIIQNTTAATLSGVWNIGTTNFAAQGGDSLIIGNPTTASAPITLTMSSGSALTVNRSRTISVSVPSTGNHKIIYQNGTAISFGTINDPNLEIVYDGNTLTSVTTQSFGNVSLINNANIDLSGSNAKFKNLTVDAGSILAGPIGASSNFIGIRAGGAVIINGTFKAGRTGGLATTSSVNVFPVTLNVTGASTTTTNSSAAVNASTTGLTRTVTCTSTSGLTVGAIISVASGTGAFPAGTFVRSITNATTFVASVPATTQLSGATISATLHSLPCLSSAGVTVGGTVAKVSGTGVYAGSTVVTGLPNGTSIATSAAPTTNFVNGATLSVSFTAATSWSTLVFEDLVPNITLGSNSTIEFNRGTSGQTAAQSIDTLSYANIILSNSGVASNKTFIAGTINVSGSFTVNNLLGNISQPSNTTINFTGSSAQTIPSQLTTFSVLGISGGTKTTSGNISVTSSLNLTSGVLATRSVDTVTVTSAGTVARTSGWVNGNLSRNLSAGSSVTRVFHIGDATNYTPLSLTFATVSTTGILTASTATPISSVANYSTAPVSTTAYVNRYWNLSKPTSSAFAFTGTYDAAITYVAGDLIGGATGASLLAARFTGGWTKTATTNSSNTNTATAQTALGNFILANDCITVTPSVSIAATSTTFCTGSSNTFTATPTNGGPSPSYQWKRNGNNIGNNSNTLILSNNDVNNGDVITCELTANNVCQTTATATSNSLTLAVGGTVTPSISITTASTTVCSGSNV
ncbi:MAG: beta strand repeat-containing protein, partial [Chitinophagaceae bacterium]